MQFGVGLSYLDRFVQHHLDEAEAADCAVIVDQLKGTMLDMLAVFSEMNKTVVTSRGAEYAYDERTIRQMAQESLQRWSGGAQTLGEKREGGPSILPRDGAVYLRYPDSRADGRDVSV